MLPKSHCYALLLLLLLATSNLNAAGRINHEFLLSRINPDMAAENAERPEGFLSSHRARMSYPGNADDSFIYQMMAQAAQAHVDIKFRGRPRGLAGHWFFIGPEVTNTPPSEHGWDVSPWSSVQGRLTDIEISDDCRQGRCRLFVGSASGGLWRTNRALANPRALQWQRIGEGLGSSNIGSITIDPNDQTESTIYVGTGENNSNFTSGAGLGLYRSTDGGDTFVQVPTMIVDPVVSPDPIDFTATRGLSQVTIHPSDPDTIYVATVTAMLGMTSVRGGQSTITGGPQGRPGLYRTNDGGNTWQLLLVAPPLTFSSNGTPDGLYEFVYGVKNVRLDPTDPSTVYASVLNDGLYRSSPALEGGDQSFKPVFLLQGFTTWDGYAAFDLAVKNGVTRAYVYNGVSFAGSAGALYRADDVNVAADQLVSGGNLTANWTNLSSPNINDLPAFISSNVCAGQCVYDQFLESPDGYPDMVYLGGNYTKLTFNPVIRSTDGGVTFHGMGYDLQTPTDATHVDVRAAVVHPDDPGVLFVAGDGGLTRTDGAFGPGAHLCQDYINKLGYGYPPGSAEDTACQAEFSTLPARITQMNEGLVTMQLFNIAGDPQDPIRRLIAGTQDNSTHIYDSTHGSPKQWKQLFALGDGTSASGFHNENPDILFASFQSNWYFVNFRNGGALPGTTQDGHGNSIEYSELATTLSWLYTGAPILFSGEASNPTAFLTGRQFMTFDPSFPDTQFTGFESVWRTTNNGGNQAFLEANCSVYDVFFIGIPGAQLQQCGDWKPLGPRLTSASFGDRANGTVVAAERSSGDDQTLWAGTSLGRLFISRNANDADHTQVDFVRLDTSAGLPERFVSGIAVHDQDPNIAYVSFSGFDAIESGGHVYKVTYDPSTHTASALELDFNLPDYPVNHIVRDDLTGDLYIANDFGVLKLTDGESEWEQAGKGLRTVLVPHLEIHPEDRKLLAGTFGLGAWYINLP